MLVWQRFVFLLCAALSFAEVSLAQETRRRPSIYEEEFQEEFESTPETPEPVLAPEQFPLFYSQFDFGASTISHPTSLVEPETMEHTLYNLGLALDVPVYVIDNFAVTLGAKVNINYPIFVNLKDGEAHYHIKARPFVSTPFGFIFVDALELDFVPAISYEIERHEYSTGNIVARGLLAQLEWKFKVIGARMFGTARPAFSVFGSYFGPGASFEYTDTNKNADLITGDFIGTEELFATKGDAFGYSVGGNIGLSFDLGDTSANDELLFGYRYDVTMLSRLKANVLGAYTDQSIESSTFLLTWRRAWEVR